MVASGALPMAVAMPSTGHSAVGAPDPRLAARPGSRASAGLLAALVVVCAYAAFARGAIEQPEEARVQVLLAVLALVGAGLWFSGRLALPRGRTPLAGLALLVAFAAWTGLSLLWSVAPDSSWAELNRWTAYALIAALALACGSSVSRAGERVALLWLLTASLVALYALATKVLPGVHIVIDLNQEAEFSRLRAPLDYWNALALVCVLALPLAAAVALDRTRSDRARLSALAAAWLLIVVTALTYSRGGVLAALVALGVLMALGRSRLRTLALAGAALLAAVAPLSVAFASTALTTDGEALGPRERAGLWLGLAALLSLAALLAAGRRLLVLERRVTWSPARSRTASRALVAAAAALLAAGLVALALSHRGLTGSIDHQVHEFTSPHTALVTDPGRLLSANSSNRWVWWKEAAGAWSAHPLDGWGAGSFPVTHLLYRKPPPLPVLQPHDVPLQLLAETGLVGALLALGGFAVLVVAAWRRVRSLPLGRERMIGAALVAAGVAWLVHGLFDWDTDIPAVTLPALLMVGVVAAPSGVRRRVRGGYSGEVPVEARSAGLLVGSLLVCAVGVSAILPAWSQSKAAGAVSAAGGANATPAQLAGAAQQAQLAARLDPLSDEPLIDAAQIAQRRGRLADAGHYLRQAVQREPYDSVAWGKLALFDVGQGDAPAAEAAAVRAVSLDPLNPGLVALARGTAGLSPPPADSATATGTPLPGG